MALTLSLQDSLKLTTGQYQREVVETQATEFKLLELLPMKKISGSSYVWNMVKDLPDAEFRGANEPIIPTSITYEQGIASLAILADEVRVDTFTVNTGGTWMNELEWEVYAKTKSILNTYERYFFNGDTNRVPAGFNGLRKLVHPSQIVAKTRDIGMDMRVMLDKVGREPSAFFMNKSTLTLLEAQNRDLITYVQQEFGKPLTHFDDVPIIALEDTMLPINCIICVKFSEEDGVCGIYNGDGLDIRALGETEAQPSHLVRLEYYTGVAVLNPKALSVRV